MNTATLMVQGCTSDAGKTTLVTALCRWLARRGLAVAPMKPQNMAPNAAALPDGGEIGRAQAVQARAARVPPQAEFNPVLLKPHSDRGAEVIVNGHSIGPMQAMNYHAYKQQAMDAVLGAHDTLSNRFDAVIVEGAGSPAEINLREHDIANMGYAEAVDCPVVLMVDIDRGGAFAHLVGTLQLLSASERARVVGFVINRFRGDPALLQSGLDWLQAETGKPVLGVLPALADLYLEAEDALPPTTITANAALRVNVPMLPRMREHTDLDALRAHPQVQLTIVAGGDTPPPADLIVLPDTAAIDDDLAWLRQAGWDQCIARHLRYGGRVLGIGSGLAMLGETFTRDEQTTRETGLACLALASHWHGKHTMQRVSGHLARDATPFTAERATRMQLSGPAAGMPAATLADDSPDGVLSADGRIMGTNLHGLFDDPACLASLLGWAGLSNADPFDINAAREASIERLADAVDAHLDTERLLGLLQPGEDVCTR